MALVWKCLCSAWRASTTSAPLSVARGGLPRPSLPSPPAGLVPVRPPMHPPPPFYSPPQVRLMQTLPCRARMSGTRKREPCLARSMSTTTPSPPALSYRERARLAREHRKKPKLNTPRRKRTSRAPRGKGEPVWGHHKRGHYIWRRGRRSVYHFWQHKFRRAYRPMPPGGPNRNREPYRPTRPPPTPPGPAYRNPPTPSPVAAEGPEEQQQTPPTPQSPPPPPKATIPRPPMPASPSPNRPLSERQPSYQLTFTCIPCGYRSRHTISKQGYHHGSVLISCPECRNRHVISDQLGIFGDRKLNVEDLMRERGRLVKKGTLGEDGNIEFWAAEEDRQGERDFALASGKTPGEKGRD